MGFAIKKTGIDYWPCKEQWGMAWQLMLQERGYGFYDGGCLILAEALQMIFSGCHVGTILTRGRADHYVVCLSQGRWADAGGVAENTEAMLRRWIEKGRPGVEREELSIVPRRIPHGQVPRSKNTSKRLAQILSPDNFRG